jgi:simple sugar transport system ATP-binding protein
MPESQTTLSIRSVSKHFGGVAAVEEVSLQVGAGQVVGIVGDNGAGKSTLIKIVSGVYAPDKGEVFLGDQRIDGMSPRAVRELGVETIYQDLALAGNLDVAANIFLGREPVKPRLLRIVDRRKMHAESRNTLVDLGFEVTDTSKRVRELAGGQQQGIAIARAVHWKARLLIMDEPTASLDMSETQNIYKTIADLRARGFSIVIISHNLQDIFSVADRVMVMRLGRKVGELDVAETDMDSVVRLIVGE